ncbi:IniB N-terminal domain-containing protein [Actinopolyspora halophila]|uniref:IniB N-terminal domain-containing protein n=1 Tax=Actinopolyspora halophila TaxID=1850 RepID=UPI0003712A2B|nr:IniB N-terminal domain-containing protein [Actinopolyspora halophila]
MPNAQPEQATGRDDSEFPTPEPVASQAAAPGQPTLQEFLTRLVGNPETRSAFDADPRGTLDNAGLGDLNATQVLHASSLMLDYAPADVVTEYGRTAQPSVDTFTASTQHVAINQLEPGQNNEQQEATETMSVDNSPAANFSSDGDVDQEMAQNQQQGQETSIDVDSNVENQDSNNLINVHDVASGNDVANNAVGVVGNTVGGTVDTAGDTVGGTVDGALGTVDSTVDTAGDAAVGAGGAALGTVNSTLDDATSTVDTTASNVTEGSTLDGATGAVGNTLDGATGTLDGVAGGAVGGVVNEAEGVVGGVTSDLPLDAL